MHIKVCLWLTDFVLMSSLFLNELERVLNNLVLKFYNTEERKIICREGRGRDDREDLKRENGEDKAEQYV